MHESRVFYTRVLENHWARITGIRRRIHTDMHISHTHTYIYVKVA